jgi:hypothetical protein
MAALLMNKLDGNGNLQLSAELVDCIKLFTGEGEWRNGKYVNINKIPKTDPRYAMLQKKPRIKQVHNETFYPENQRKQGSIWFKINGYFMVINRGFKHIRLQDGYYDGYITEIHYKNTKTCYFV